VRDVAIRLGVGASIARDARIVESDPQPIGERSDRALTIPDRRIIPGGVAF
jgi:hypothetical protein